MNTQYLQLTDGTLAYDDSGTPGPLVMMVPSLGDVRQEYRFVAPKLAAAGYRVVTVDMRGQGESSANWPDYSVASIGGDILALIEQLNAGPAVLVTTSYSASAAVWLAAEHPDAVRGLVLIGAFVRNVEASLVVKLGVRLITNGPWKVWAWDMFYKSLYPSQTPPDFAAYRRQLKANLAEPGRFAALKGMIEASREDSERRLGRVQAPTLVMMGSKDPDFPSPQAEADFIATATGGRVVLVDGAGHYPHAEMPAITLPILADFLQEVAQPHGAQTRLN